MMMASRQRSNRSRRRLASPERLASRVVSWELLFSCITAFVLYNLPPFLLLLKGPVGSAAAFALTMAVLLAGSLGVAQGWSLVFARRKLLASLGRGSRSLNQIELPKLNDDPWRIVNAWVLTSILAVVLAMTIFRPAVIPPSTALTLGLFSAIILAAASLPLLMLVRRDFVQVMESVPPDIMGEIIDAQVRSGRLRGRTSRRLLAAIVTPVAFLAIGSGLIAGAHLRSSDEAARQHTAITVVRGSLPPLSDQPPDEDPGVKLAQATLARAGYRTTLLDDQPETESTQSFHGMVTMSAPVGRAGALIEFLSTTASPMSWGAIPVALAALFAASWLGLALGRLLSGDLRMANHGVRMLGTDAALEGTRVMKPARFRAVAELGHSIELLASRFRMFAQAQERSISARESATRARGRFFASVSHDLKSPLNAILGFAELCETDPSTNSQQKESLDLIVSRGRELLALIETILDAARVEAGQLKLEPSDERIEDLLELAIDKARELNPDSLVLVLLDIPEGTPPLKVDRIRFSQALAAFIGHAQRTAERASLRVLVDIARPRALTSNRRKLVIHVEVPSSQFSAQELDGMLSPEQHPGQHRGVALTLRLAKGIIELHRGTVRVTGRTVREPAFAIEMPLR